MTRFRRAMSLLLSICLVMAMLLPEALAAELANNANLDDTGAETSFAALEALSEGDSQWHEVDVSEGIFQAGSLTGPQFLSDGPALFSSENSAGDRLYHTILNGLLNRADRIDISDFWFPNSEEGVKALSEWYILVFNNNPELFYAMSFYQYYSNSGYIKEIAPIYATDLPSNSQQLFDAAVQKALAQVQPGMSAMEAMLVLHDYLVVNCVYNWDVAVEKPEESHDRRVYTAYGVLVLGDAVCQGYALAYKYLLNQLGIPCVLASSEAMNHAWNQVSLNDKWYHVDATWDDPVPNTYGKCLHDFFLLSDAAISDASHRHHDWTAPNYCTDTTFDTGYVYPDVFHPFYWKGSDIYYLEYDRSVSRERLRKAAGDSREEVLLLGYPDPNSGACWLDDCLYYIGTDNASQNWEDTRGIYYCDITSGRQGCIGYFRYTRSASSDGYYKAEVDTLGMRYLPSMNKFLIESSTRPGQTPFCNFDPVDLPDYPASWDDITGNQFIGMLSDGRVGVRTEVGSSVLWIAYYNTSGKMTGLERQVLAESGIYLVSPKTPDASISQAKLMLTSAQGTPLCFAFPLAA